ncbi:MAG: peptide chain release factor N(5)-glutamine methyltransferase [Sphingomonadales bacterium]|nr:peptide chain release factor N(5)-glutamine methyltransferase [Sphingomonadales bacterium]
MADSAAQALAKAAAMLESVSETPRLDAEILLAHAAGIVRSALLPQLRDLPVPDGFTALVQRRISHVPVAYITGSQPFWDIELAVTPDVLIPRADSETLIEAAIGYFDQHHPRSILDLGTGSGALLLAALSAFPQASGIAIDASAAALTVASVNAERLGFAHRTRFLHRSWRDAGWADDLGQFDLILCNPPYVESEAALAPQVRDFEPASALFAGADGLDDYRVVIPQIPELLSPQGLALFEIGKGQEPAVSILAQAASMTVTQHHDLAGIVRSLGLTHSTSG